MPNPKVRFKREDGTDFPNWSQTTIGDEGTFYYGHSCPKWSVSEDAPIPCVRYGELYTKFGTKIEKTYSRTNIPREKLRFSKGTEVLIPRVGEDPYDYNHCTWLSIPNVAIGEMISVYNTDNNPLFTATMFNATLQNEFAKRVEGFSVTNLYFEELKNIITAFPCHEEQQKIADFFSTVDEVIAQSEQEVQNLEQQKKAAMQKIFSREVRFKRDDGTNYPDWEKKKLGDIGDVAMCKRVLKEQTAETGDVPFFKIGTLGNEADAFLSRDLFETLKEKYSYPEEGNILLCAAGTIGRPVIFDGKDAYFQDSNIVWLKHNNSVIDAFLYQFYLQVNWENLEGGTIKRLYNGLLLATSISVPHKEEQQKIADFLSAYDEAITYAKQELDKWKELKKGLLQQMFV